MKLFDLKKKIEEDIKPYRYRYELDEENNSYYFILYNKKLKTVFMQFPKVSLSKDDLMKNKIKCLKDRYNNL